METCPRCQTRDQNLRNFCKKCGYKFLGSTIGLSQYIPPQRGNQRTFWEQLRTEGAGIKKSRIDMTKEGLVALLDNPDLVEERKEKAEINRTYFTFRLANVFSQKWGIFAGSVILSLIAAVIYCSAIHCTT